jgi:endonuclease YncB( thermonuclease family)
VTWIKKFVNLTILVILFFPISGAANTRVIDKVLSGDLVQIGDSFVARLTGIEAPPKDEPLGYRIYDFTKRELEGKMVKLFTWTTDNTAEGIVRDENGCAFVEIEYWKGEYVSFNEVLLQKGYARVDRKYLPENLKHYIGLEKEAREKGLGIWEKTPFEK